MSVSKVKSEIERINTRINSKKTAFAWLDPSDKMVHTSQKTGEDEVMTVEEWESEMKAKGYTELFLVTWNWVKT